VPLLPLLLPFIVIGLAIAVIFASIARAQVFYSAEEFYGYLEHRARLEAIAVEASARATEAAEAERQSAREKEHRQIIEAVEDEAYARALRAIQE